RRRGLQDRRAEDQAAAGLRREGAGPRVRPPRLPRPAPRPRPAAARSPGEEHQELGGGDKTFRCQSRRERRSCCALTFPFPPLPRTSTMKKLTLSLAALLLAAGMAAAA